MAGWQASKERSQKAFAKYLHDFTQSTSMCSVPNE